MSRNEIDILLNSFAQYEDGPIAYKEFCKFLESTRREELRVRRRRYKDRCDVARTLLDEMMDNEENDEKQERRFDSYVVLQEFIHFADKYIYFKNNTGTQCTLSAQKIVTKTRGEIRKRNQTCPSFTVLGIAIKIVGQCPVMF